MCGDGWNSECVVHYGRDASSDEFIDFELDSGAHFTVRQVADRLTKGTHIDGLYFVKCQIRSADI